MEPPRGETGVSLLSVSGITKSFGGVTANKGISFGGAGVSSLVPIIE